MSLTFSVPGIPAPKGSKRAFVVRTKEGRMRPVLAEDSKATGPWRARVALAAKHAMLVGGLNGWHARQALSVHLVFLLARPLSLPKTRRAHITRPDVDKLVRAVLDALKGVVYGDDSQIVHLVALKQYSHSGEGPGVTVRIGEES